MITNFERRATEDLAIAGTEKGGINGNNHVVTTGLLYKLILRNAALVTAPEMAMCLSYIFDLNRITKTTFCCLPMESSLKTHGLIGHRIMDYDAFYVPNFITVSLPNIISSDNFAVLTPCAYEQDEEEEYLIRKVWPLFIETRKPGIGTYISTQILDSPQPQWKNLANRRWRSFQRNSSIYMTDTQFHLLMDSLQIWGMC